MLPSDSLRFSSNPDNCLQFVLPTQDTQVDIAGHVRAGLETFEFVHYALNIPSTTSKKRLTSKNCKCNAGNRLLVWKRSRYRYHHARHWSGWKKFVEMKEKYSACRNYQSGCKQHLQQIGWKQLVRTSGTLRRRSQAGASTAGRDNADGGRSRRKPQEATLEEGTARLRDWWWWWRGRALGRACP